MDKPFKTVEEQVALLESRGMATDSNTPDILLREGYYSVVNGYKAPFIDRDASAAAKDDRYLPGSKFEDVYSLFRFDRELRLHRRGDAENGSGLLFLKSPCGPT